MFLMPEASFSNGTMPLLKLAFFEIIESISFKLILFLYFIGKRARPKDGEAVYPCRLKM